MIPSKFRYWASVVLTNYGRATEVAPGRLSFMTRSAASRGSWFVSAQRHRVNS